MENEWTYKVLIYLFAVVSVYAAITDLRRFKIPNLVPLSLLLLYPFYVWFAPHQVDWLHSLAITAAVFAVGLYIFSRGWAGGGDIKFLVAASLWSPPHLFMDFLAIVAIAGGALSVCLLLLHAMRRKTASANNGALLSEMNIRKMPAPYGVAICCGCLVTAFYLLSNPAMIG